MLIFVAGVPSPQGSKNAFRRGSKIVLVESSKALPEWRRRLVEAFTPFKGLTTNPGYENGATVSVEFYLPRPKSVKRQYPTTKPDLDKLIRSVGDALEIGGVIDGDSKIVQWIASKRYADTMEPGVTIEVKPL
jgi:Holliday junction resolvase RusA-like endonuclease